MPWHHLSIGSLQLEVWTLFGRVPVALFFVALLVAGLRRGWPWRSALLATAALGAGLSLGTALLPSVLGALGGGLGAWLLAQRLLGLRRPPLGALAVGLTLVVAIGRLGCLCAGCCFGTVSALPWAMHYDAGSAPWLLHRALGLVAESAPTSLGVQPYPLYEALALVLFLPVLLWLLGRLRSEGAALAATAAYDLAVRAGIDGTRAMINVWWAKLGVFAGLDRLQWALVAGALLMLGTAVTLERRARRAPASAAPEPASLEPSALATWGVFLGAWLVGFLFDDAQTPFLHRVHVLSLLAAAPAVRLPRLERALPRLAEALAAPAVALALASLLATYVETTLARADDPDAAPSVAGSRGWLYEVDHRRGLLIRLGNARNAHATLSARRLALQLGPIPDAPLDTTPIPEAPTDATPVPETTAVWANPLDVERPPEALGELAHRPSLHWLGVEGSGGSTSYAVGEGCGSGYTIYDRAMLEAALRYEAQLPFGENWTASFGGRAGVAHAVTESLYSGGTPGSATREDDWLGFANAWAEVGEPHFSVGLALYGDLASEETSVAGFGRTVDEPLRVRVGGHLRAGFSPLAFDIGYLDRDALLGITTLRFGLVGMLTNAGRSVERLEDTRIRYGVGLMSYPSSREWVGARTGYYLLGEYLPTPRLALSAQAAYFEGGGMFGLSVRYGVGD
jgi:phosphatidylglycerol:prolipoprotein diacylglycerol transferase